MGETIVRTYGRASADGEFWELDINGRGDYGRLATHSFFELPDRIESLSIKNLFDISPALSHISINFPPVDEALAERLKGRRFIRPHFELHFEFLPDLRAWKSDHSPEEYVNQFVSSLADPRCDGIEFKHYGAIESYGFGISFPVATPLLQIGSEVERCLPTVRQLDRETLKAVTAHLNPGSVMLAFDFPGAVRVPCEQYPLYFTRFREDLGVKATADLRHEAGQILFSVTPKNKDDALDKIREALMIYPGMSARPVSNISAPDYEIAAQRPVSEIQSLQSRVTLARAELQLKEATIQQQQVTIDQLRPPGGAPVLESLQQITLPPSVEDREAVIEGLLALKKFEWNFLEIGFPELFRRLRQLFTNRDK